MNMFALSFTFRQSTHEEILTFSEEYSNACRLDPNVRFTTAILNDENYAIFATKKTSFEPFDGKDEEYRILFFLLLEHPLSFQVTLFDLFNSFIKEMTFIEPIKQNLGKSKSIYWNLQNEENHIYFEEIIYQKGRERTFKNKEIYKDGLLTEYKFEKNAWKEKSCNVERYYYEQKLAYLEESPYTLEEYSDHKCAMQLCISDSFILHMYYDNLEQRNYDHVTKKIIPLTKEVHKQIENYCDGIIECCMEYTSGTPILTPFLQEQFAELKKAESEIYDKIWKMPDLNEPYFAKTKAKLLRMFYILRELKLPTK